jgi:hypothetical protein
MGDAEIATIKRGAELLPADLSHDRPESGRKKSFDTGSCVSRIFDMRCSWLYVRFSMSNSFDMEILMPREFAAHRMVA